MSSIPGTITDAIDKPLHADKVLHLAVFALGAFLWAWATGSGWRAFAIAFLVGLGKEVWQGGLIPGRSFELLDVAADAIGSLLGSFTFYLYARQRRRPTPR